MNSARIIAVGDIHGCAEALRSLIAAVEPTAADTWVVLGDVIDRGPDSAGVIEQLMELQDACRLVFLLGNHEQMMLDVVDHGEQPAFWLTCGGSETVESYGEIDQIPPSHVEWLRRHRLAYETDEYFFVHANYVAHLPLEEQPTDVLLWQHLTTSFPEPHVTGRIAVVGHTPQTDGVVLDAGHVIGIDTYCVGGGWLTALDVTRRWTWQADRDGRMRRPGGMRLSDCSKNDF